MLPKNWNDVLAVLILLGAPAIVVAFKVPDIEQAVAAMQARKIRLIGRAANSAVVNSVIYLAVANYLISSALFITL